MGNIIGSSGILSWIGDLKTKNSRLHKIGGASPGEGGSDLPAEVSSRQLLRNIFASVFLLLLVLLVVISGNFQLSTFETLFSLFIYHIIKSFFFFSSLLFRLL